MLIEIKDDNGKVITAVSIRDGQPGEALLKLLDGWRPERCDQCDGWQWVKVRPCLCNES